jgi:hypothetical protein
MRRAQILAVLFLGMLAGGTADTFLCRRSAQPFERHSRATSVKTETPAVEAAEMKQKQMGTLNGKEQSEWDLL